MMQRDPSLPPETLPLTEASVQEIQLELMGRRSFNEFNGPRVVASLRKHRKLWRAAYMDRLGFVAEKHGSSWGLIKLRDLPKNYWNVDDLFILTDTLHQARELERIAQEEEWKADNVQLMENDDERGRQLGEYPARGYVISFWWD